MPTQANIMVVRRRVLQMTVSMSESGTKVSLEMGSLLRTREEDMDRKIKRLTGESAVS